MRDAWLELLSIVGQLCSELRLPWKGARNDVRGDK